MVMDDGSWIHRGLITGSLEIVHDGSFMVDLDPEVCSAGFIIYCNQSNQTAIGSVVEKTSSADNSRGEILGGIMVQLVLRAATP